jgi:hypothetical protein
MIDEIQMKDFWKPNQPQKEKNNHIMNIDVKNLYYSNDKTSLYIDGVLNNNGSNTECVKPLFKIDITSENLVWYFFNGGEDVQIIREQSLKNFVKKEIENYISNKKEMLDLLNK